MPPGVERRAVNLTLLAALLCAGSALAVPFNISITNTGTNTAYPWSVGLLTLNPTIAIGLSPQPGSPSYPTYSYANSHCALSDSFCSGSCNDNGNAVVLAQRLGLTLGVDAWLVPALAAGGNATATVAIDAPVGSRLSYIAWINNTSVFDDFVAMHPPGVNTTLSVPLFDGSGAPLASPVFQISGYDTNSTSPTNGGGATCSQECPTQTAGCYVAPGNASQGTYPNQPSTPVSPLSLTASGPTTTTLPQVTYTLTYANQSGSRIRNSVLTYLLPAGVTLVSASNGGALSGSTVTWNINRIDAGTTAFQTVTVNLGVFGSTTPHSGSIAWAAGGSNYNLSSNVVTTVYSVWMVPAWTFTDPTGHFTDGLAVGDLDATSAGSEILVVAPMRGTSSGPGRSIVLRNTGTEVSTLVTAAGRNVMGLPLAENLVGGGTLEYLFGEAHPASASAALFARMGDSTTPLWTSMPYGYASYWNMGPSSANVSAAAGTEVVVADWDGHVNLLTGSSGAPLATTYNTWDTDGDHAFGHVALADIDLDGTFEAVIFGNTLGTVMALNAETMTLQWKSASLKTLYGDAAYGSGPAIGDVDADGRPEIVVATRGTTSDIYVFNESGVCEQRFDPGGSFTYTSPVIGHVDGSGFKSIVALSSTNSVLSVMRGGTPGCATAGGTITWQHTIKAGEGAAFTPVLYDVNGDGVLDVIAASRTRLEVIDVRNRRVILSFEDPTAGFTPSGVIANADGTGARELYVPGWRNSKVYRFTLPATATSTNDWTTFMGGNTRTGSR